MKILMFLICVVYFSNVQPKDAEQSKYTLNLIEGYLSCFCLVVHILL